jgi:hypothetical protein
MSIVRVMCLGRIVHPYRRVSNAASPIYYIPLVRKLSSSTSSPLSHQNIGPLDPNNYSFVRPLVFSFSLAALCRCYILEWLYLLTLPAVSTSDADAPDAMLQPAQLPIIDITQGFTLPDGPIQITGVSQQLVSTNSVQRDTEARERFLRQAKALMSELFVLFNEYPKFMSLPRRHDMDDANQVQPRPVLVLWRKLIHLVDAHSNKQR